LPPRAVDMLTVRFGQLTVRGLSPLKIRSLVGCSANVQLTGRGAADLPDCNRIVRRAPVERLVRLDA
ncbi:MAG: hypothetical protein MN733_05785, partial [Nitrososphaera sp.]|nr:hypothetical protein [Nitrososphaera sp.]